MRIRAERDQRTRVISHRLRHVRVEIEGHDDRHVGTDRVTQAPQQLALAILVFVGHHGAVQMQERAVDRALLLRGADDEPRDLLEGAARHQARWVGTRGDRMDQRPAVLVRGLEGGAESRACIAECRGNLVLEVKVAAPERRHVRQHAAEGVGLVREAGGEHALGHRRVPL